MSEVTAPARSRVGTASDAAANRLRKVVDHEAIRHNVRVLRAAARGRKLMPVVKGDAYGLGAGPVARTLVDAGVEALAVDTVAEGMVLRAAGITHPVLVMDVDVPENAEACVDVGLAPSVARPNQARRLAELAGKRGKPVTVWLRTNVGFNRFGPRDNFEALLDDLRRFRGPLRFAGAFAHLTSSAWESEETAAQAAEFARRLDQARTCLGGHMQGSLAATHGLVHDAALAGTSWVRPGIGLFGSVVPSVRRLAGWPASGLAGLRPAWQVHARLLDIVELTRAEGLGYDRAVAVLPGQRVASVAIGFSRGITAAADVGSLLHGRVCSPIGRPGMDCSQFDVTDVPEAKAGDWLTLIGTSGPTTQDAEQLSAKIGCSLYELMATFHMPVRHDGLRRPTRPDQSTEGVE